jgi:hypothetical protein
VRTLKNFIFRTLLCLVGQYDATKKKSPETANNRPARGSSGGSTRLPVQDSSGGATCHRGSGSHLPAQGSSGVGTCPVGFNTRLPTQDSSGGAACPHGFGPDEKRRAEQLRKQSSRRFFLAPAARRKAAPGTPHVPVALGRMKTVEPMQKT